MNQNDKNTELNWPIVALQTIALLIFVCYTTTLAIGWNHKSGSAMDKPEIQTPTAAIPTPRTDDDWIAKHDNLVTLVRSEHPVIAFFGDSITEAMNVDLLHKIISPESDCFGIGGDKTQHLLWRLRKGELEFSAPVPQVFVVLIGTNNISSWLGNPASSSQDIYLGVQAILNEIRGRFPEARILLLGILPRDKRAATGTRAMVDETNKLLKKLADNKHIWYADIGKSLLEADGQISANVMSDFLHPTQELGYELMFRAIKPYVCRLLDKTNSGA